MKSKRTLGRKFRILKGGVGWFEGYSMVPLLESTLLIIDPKRDITPERQLTWKEFAEVADALTGS